MPFSFKLQPFVCQIGYANTLLIANEMGGKQQ